MLPYWVFSLVVYYQLLRSNLPPNSNKPENMWKEDKLAKPIEIKAHIWTVIILFSSIVAWNLYFYANQTLCTIDILEFGIIQLFFLLRIKCYEALGDHFTFQLGTWKNHNLVQHGPYKYLVHPSYTGQFGHLFMSYIFLKLPWYLIIILILFSLSHFPKRVRNEEKMMLDKFGDEYKSYLKQRYKVIPFIY